MGSTIGKRATEPGRRGPRRANALLLVATATAAIGALAAAWATAIAAGAPKAQTVAAEQRTATCTFTNPAYSGECVESTTIAEDSTAKKACQAILGCLNNPRCVTTYCNASTLRSGWVLKKTEEF